ncbi:hypothetical protein N7499_005032 [Penicillium canescens]|uniref:Major facilitator superfamily (MFS) profile domain-containing protein n=1 Tax=Penicillium canescens TaxID=5083 RepID=A0AAD6I218_PENCN|nr:hypothetical protein N7460_011745 [Penicillium canescens]KAJ6085403.1 hypothetical protein N7499_005032 [Penicillium canescens]KAJ6162182.1 hypothetical protein N7485_010412 [Penicillium canescens]
MQSDLGSDCGTLRESDRDLRYQIPEYQPLLDVLPQSDTKRVDSHGVLIIICTICSLFICCALNGLLTLNIAQISSELKLTPGVELWPISLFFLTQGCTFILAGSLTDVLGSRRVFLSGCFLQTVCYLTTGLAQGGAQLIASRIVSGMAYSMCLLSSMSIHRENLQVGKLRDLAFSSTTACQYVGHGAGIILAGLLSVTTGWRSGFHCAAIVSLCGFLLSIWTIPKQAEEPKGIPWRELYEDIDWLGTLLASFLMALLFFALAAITNHVADICKSGLFIPLALGWLFLVAFLFWQDCWDRDSTQGVQDSLWTKGHFICISLVVFFVYFSFHSSSQLVVLVFERVQGLSVLQSSWRFLPVPVAGALGGLITGKFLPRLRANKILEIAIIISSLPPFIMAIFKPTSSYWGYEFFAVSLGSIAPSATILISSMIIAESLPFETQGLATGVICTVAMVGSSIGMSLAGFISYDVTTSQSRVPGESASFMESPEAIMGGYRAAFWFLFVMNIVGLGITLCCLRKIGYLGRTLNLT